MRHVKCIRLMRLPYYTTDLSNEELRELKLLLARFFAEKSIRLANKIWDEKGLTDDDMDRLLNELS